MPEAIDARDRRARFVIACLSWMLGSLAMLSSARAAEPTFRLIEGSGGVPIALMEWGDKTGPGILFLHGFGFSSEFWLPQTTDPELGGFHMAAIDLRGHGASGKPWKVEDLVETKVWAEDVAAAIEAAGLERPVIVGWSYGGYVAMDYVRHFGSKDISGIVLVASPAGLADRLHPGGDDLPGGPEAYQKAAEQRESLSTVENMPGNRYLAELMTVADLSEDVLAQWTAQMMRIPVYVTRGLRQGRSLENRDLLDSLDLPMALVVGGQDKSMPFEALQSLAENKLTKGEYWLFESAGHAVSTDAAEAFDARLLAFTKRVAK